MNVLILAGSRQGEIDPVARACGVAHKALAPLCGQPMLLYVMRAVQSLPQAAKVAVCIENPQLVSHFLPHDTTYLEAHEGPSASVLHALEALGTPTLVTTADHALLKPEWVVSFLSGIRADTDVAVAIATKERIGADAPPTRRTFISLADGAFSGCNLFFLRTERAANLVHFWQKLEKNRKNPLRMGRFLGGGVIMRYLLGRLTREHLVRRIYALTQCRVQFVALPDGMAAVDVDKPDDLSLAQHVLEARGA